ncbi:MAG: pseudouridine synthase [Flammeovirgaceae bacterium]
MNLDLLYRDNFLVIINKPSGLLVHKSEVDKHETQNAMHLLRDQLGQWVYTAHRIDKPTSGILVFALDQATARMMTAVFTTKQVVKKYLAVVRGYTPELATIDHPLKVRYDRTTDRKARTDKPPQAATTTYKRLATVELPFAVGRYSTARYSLIEAQPLTGRNRQIRRHMKHIFHPIIGDTSHGDGKHNDFFREQFQCHRLLLHAHQLQFKHPHTGEMLTVHAPLDQPFSGLLKKLDFPIPTPN